MQMQIPGGLSILRRSPQFLGGDGKRYEVVSGVISNDGTGWKVTAGDHALMNVASVTQDADKITINFSRTGAKVVGFQVCGSYTFQTQGYIVGASVGTGLAYLYLRQRVHIGGYIYYTGTAWEVFPDRGTPGNVVSSWIDTYLKVSHDPVLDNPVSSRGYPPALSKFSNGYHPAITDYTSTNVYIEFYNSSGAKVTTPDTNMKFVLSRPGVIAVNPINITGYSVWFQGFVEL